MRVAISTVPSRVAPPAPYVTDTKSGASGFNASTVSNSSSTFSGVFGGKNSIEKTGSGSGRISSMRICGMVERARRRNQSRPRAYLVSVVQPKPDEAVTAKREPTFLLAKPEKRLLRWIATRLPRWILPDDLTALGVLAAFAICAAYQLSNDSLVWLWVASGLLVVHWLGDSLDGTLARVRGIERPKYGFYLDHLVDAVSTAAIGIGLGLSPFMLLSVGTLIVVAYLVLSINVYLESYALGRFSIGYGLIGPTELRLILIALNTALALHLGLDFNIVDLNMTVFDLMGLGLAGTMLVLLAGRVARNLRDLGRQEPAAKRVFVSRRSRRARSSSTAV